MKKASPEVEIIQKEDKRLRQISKEVPRDRIKSPEIARIIGDMKAAMEDQPDAVAIAAIQIAEPVRIFVISKRAAGFAGKSEEKAPAKDMVFINPKIVRQSKKKQLLEEGCLSVRYIYGEVPRAEKTSVEALDENGKKFTRGFSGLFSQIVQHEIDHLDGKLFIDKAKHTMELSKEEYEKNLAKNS